MHFGTKWSHRDESARNDCISLRPFGLINIQGFIRTALPEQGKMFNDVQKSTSSLSSYERPLRNPWMVLALTGLAQFAAFLDTTLLFVAFPSIRRSFPAVSDGELSWVLNAYSIVFAAFLLTGGRLADHFGRRKLFLLGIAIFTVSSALCGAAANPALLITFRAVQAAGGALLLPPSLALVRVQRQHHLQRNSQRSHPDLVHQQSVS
jgi:hypothetical protein